MNYTDADLERAARALCEAQHFTSSDAPVIVGMKPVPAWTTRLRQVRAVIDALRDSDEHRNGEDAQRLSGEAMPARAEGIAQKG